MGKTHKETPREVLMYKRDERYQKQLEQVPTWEVNEEDKKLVLKFMNNLEAQSLTYGRKEKELFYLYDNPTSATE